jgi:hypothetical protein
MRRLMQSTAVLVTLSLFAIACGKDTSEPSARGMCTGGVKLHVTAGLTPDISWTPDCKLFMVGVELASTGDDRWFVASTDISTAGGLSSPIHYGVLPPGAVLVDGPVPLQQGVANNALAFRLPAVNPDTANPILAGVLVFTP